jgi:GNAT superfamily N-acetyltransferase
MTFIDYATPSDLTQILQWLKKDDSGFYGNQKLLETALSERQLVVYRGQDDVTAFLAFGVSPDGILAVRKDAQRRGIGSTLARYGIDQEVKSGTCILKIECCPLTSIPFWKRFGFTIYPGTNQGYKIIEKPLIIPKKSQRAHVRIDLYSPDEWHADREPLYRLAPVCAVAGNRLYFAERTILSQCPPITPKSYARIFVNDIVAFEDQLRGDEEDQSGIKQDPRGNFYVEELKLPS